jgi:hypothetical protein
MVHWVLISPGRPPSSFTTAKVVAWNIHCTQCILTVRESGRWGAFICALCGSRPQAVHASGSNVPHDLCPVTGGWSCLRCRLPVTTGRRAAAAVATCPFPEVVGTDGQPRLAGRVQMQCNADITSTCHTARKFVPTQVAPVVPPPPAQEVFMQALHWVLHWKLTYGSTDVCLACGRKAIQRARIPLGATKCEGICKPTAALLTPLRAGVFDTARMAAARPWRDRALTLGWKPVVPGPTPAPTTPCPCASSIVAPSRRRRPMFLVPTPCSVRWANLRVICLYFCP